MFALVFTFKGIWRDQLALPVPDLDPYFMSSAGQLKKIVMFICL